MIGRERLMCMKCRQIEPIEATIWNIVFDGCQNNVQTTLLKITYCFDFWYLLFCSGFQFQRKLFMFDLVYFSNQFIKSVEFCYFPKIWTPIECFYGTFTNTKRQLINRILNDYKCKYSYWVFCRWVQAPVAQLRLNFISVLCARLIFFLSFYCRNSSCYLT